MMHAALATLSIALILLISELLWQKAHLRGEFARKFIHIIAGIFVAFLPFWVSYGWIALLGVGFVLMLLVNRYTPLFNAIHAVKRKSWGDLLAGIAGIICALLRPSPWLFAGAILQVSLADGMAAVIGSHYAKKRYKVFDHVKSPLGTTVFFIGSFITLLSLLLAGGLFSEHVAAPLIFVPLLLTILENVSGFGSDNITLPLGFLVLLRLFNVS